MAAHAIRISLRRIESSGIPRAMIRMRPIVGRGRPRYGLLRLCLLLSAASGCQSPQSSTPSARLATMIIKDRSIAQVESSTQGVCQSHAYQAARPGPADFLFEKHGTGMNTLMYGDWTPGQVWV